MSIFRVFLAHTNSLPKNPSRDPRQGGLSAFDVETGERPPGWKCVDGGGYC